MINFTPINKNVRRTLAKRSEALVRDSVSDPFAPVSEDLISTTSRSIWVKMFSPVLVKKEGQLVEGARIFGGEVFQQDGEFPILYGYGQTYGRVKSGINETISEGRPIGPQTPLQRPIPGITNFTCNYEGGLSAIRLAEVNFVIWSLEDLERLTPNFFAPGRGVLLEWGYGSLDTSTTETISDDDMIAGNAYNKINRLVLESGGMYDGIAGVISNYNYSLRADGGFDCTIKLVSRGVNVLNEQLDNSDQVFKSKSGDDSGQNEVEAWPTLDEFMSILEEELLSVTYDSSAWFTSVETVPLSSKDDETWDTSKQPPGVFVYQDDATLSFEKRAGPYVTWGWLEDNILSKWVGRFDKDKKTVNQFRSIEPVMDMETGDFLDESGNPTKDIEKAKFESVKISNHKYLVTPHMDRWVLPGQFPADQKVDPDGSKVWDAVKKTANVLTLGLGSLIDYFHTSGDEFRNAVASVIENGVNFEKFAVEGDESKGYLRNILLSTDLIRDSFKEAKTLKEGMQALFDNINEDVEGFWSFNLVNDSYLNGNIKVVDTKATMLSPKQLLEVERPKGNPDSALYVFDSWGEKSIVRTQELAVELPSAFAVTAMYAGVSKEGAETSAGATDESALGKLMTADGKDPSQPEVVKPSRIEGNFGSSNPFKLEGAGALPSTENKYFGPGKGIPFKNIDYIQLLTIMDERLKDSKEAQQKVGERTEDASTSQVARSDEAIDNFVEAYFNTQLYDDKGNLGKDVKKSIIHKKVMNNILKGQVNFDTNTNLKPEDLYDTESATDLFPVNLSIEIDGVGGIFPGNVFHVSYIQERFKEFCVFQIFSVNHTISAESWVTNIEGKLRVASGKFLKDINTHTMQPERGTRDTDGESEENSYAAEPVENGTTEDEGREVISNQSDDYDIQFTGLAQNETEQISGTSKARMNTVVYAFDKKNPNRQQVKGEASELFSTGETEAKRKAKMSTRLSAESRAVDNFKAKYNLK